MRVRKKHLKQHGVNKKHTARRRQREERESERDRKERQEEKGTKSRGKGRIEK